MKLIIFKLLGFIQDRPEATGYIPPRTEHLPGFNQWSHEVFIKKAL